MEFPTDNTLPLRFLRGLAASPDGVAVRHGDTVLTYRQLHERALLWAGALIAERARTVGVLARKGPEAYTAILAALFAGAAVVPLRPDFPAARLAQMADAAGVQVLVADREALPALAEVRGNRAVLLVGPEGAVQADGLPYATLKTDPAAAPAAPLPTAPDDLAYVLFTSGSTGRPKGVRLTHGAFAHYFSLLDARYDFGPDDVFSQVFDLNFDCSVFDLFCAWGAGAEFLTLPPQAFRALPEFLAEHGVTVWFSTPSAIALVRRTGGLAPGALPGLRWSFFAGEALTCRDVEDWRAAAPAATVENLYGPTELTVTIAAYRWSDTGTPAVAVNGVVPIGAVHAGHEVLLLDPDGQPAEEVGELCIAGPQLTPGYLDPGDGAGRFLERGGRTYYRTGDRARRIGPDGTDLAYLGRLDSQIQVQGWRIEPAEVEHALRALGVRDAVVVGAPTPAGTVLVAYYTGAAVPAVDLVRGLRELVPAGAIPRRFLQVEEFPLSPNRKVDRGALTARAAGLQGL
ncbi:AMP-binding protein [Kitasatospora phosalacinea]|uniref:AMP-binding protein n=1 Tax=Kitasatospora phosalacinea TaxID=2065 RepID=A0ABW6GW54_9ACTN